MNPSRPFAICALALAPAALFASPLKLDPKSNFTVGGRTGSGQYDPSDTYFVGAQEWVVNLYPVEPLYRRVVSDEFNQALFDYILVNPGWSFQYSLNELGDNSLLVRTYDAEQGRNADGPCPTCVGAEFAVEYRRLIDDNPTQNVHWMQLVCTNHMSPGSHGDEGCYFDPYFNFPYYDPVGSANVTGFYDFPTREYDRQHNWVAELYLVTGPPRDRPGQVTIWGGVVWGWENHAVPEPSSWALLGCGVLLVGFLRRTWRRAG